MGRRKLIFYGRELRTKFQVALGYSNPERVNAVFDDIEPDLSLPKIDWAEIEEKLNINIQNYAKTEIDNQFEALFRFRVRMSISKIVGEPDEVDDVSESDFNNKVEKIETLAKKLAAEIDGLSDIGSLLLVRPRAKDGLTSAEKSDRFYSQVSGQTDEPNEEDFFEYYSFRKLLDYYENFTKINSGFKSVLGSRFDRNLDYSWYEYFVRRSVLALWATDFPMETTIPTDTNIEFMSPIVMLFDELRGR